MNLAKLIRYLTIVGALLIMLSFLMEWVVITDGGYLIERPLGVLLLGIALFAESFIPVTEKARRVMPALLIFSAIAAVFIVLWAALHTALRMVSLPTIALGPGPLIAIAGLSLFIIGTIGSLQLLANPGDDEPNYRIIGLD